VSLQEYESIVASTPQKADDYTKRRSRAGRDSTKKTPAASRSSARSRIRGAARPRYSTAAAASAAATHGDGYKPREERGWEEFHPDLDLDSAYAVVLSEEIDGLVKPKSTNADDGDEAGGEPIPQGVRTPMRRRPGRPTRTRDSMLHAILTPEAPKVVPMPGPNPRERLTLPKPSYRELDPFLSYERKEIAKEDFVDKIMASVGYQEGELFLRPERTYIRQMEGSAEEDLDLSPGLMTGGENSAIGSNGVGRVEYDMDEQDVKWLEEFNKKRTEDGVGSIRRAVFEITMTKVEKEWHALEKRIPKPNPKAPQTQRPRSSSAAAKNGDPQGEEPDSKCAICDDGDCENANAIVFCDGCDLAVHQECYGVPYIPEGQWLCRKCQLVGNARPSCIFCPNEGGAFKQTLNSKWAHLFCAFWIPEVNIGNPSLMEPITDVEKVPPSRWKLLCYICKQDMGASIQCSDGRCYEAFHLTCARQAGLYLQMKTIGGQNTLMDPSQLRAYCHKHTPADWRVEHKTDRAFETTLKHYKHHFQGQIWADSRASALAISDPHDIGSSGQGLQRLTLTNKKGQKQKTVWRLPSGAPVIPEIILKSIEDSLARFLVQKKKEYVAEICKYWTLKREARRGAALLKRLQLQMDTFSSFEVTRRDYKAQGAAGRARLERRIQFAEMLAQDLERIRHICELIKEREAEKLQNAGLLKEVVNTVYFPITPLLEPILDKAMKLDTKMVFREGMLEIMSKLNKRGYTTVAPFSVDLAHVLGRVLDVQARTAAELLAKISGRAPELSIEQRDVRTLARRIIKAVQPAVEDALRKEAELTGRPYAQEMKEMDDLLFSRRGSLTESIDVPTEDPSQLVLQSNSISRATPATYMDEDVDMQDVSTVNGIPNDPSTIMVQRDQALPTNSNEDTVQLAETDLIVRSKADKDHGIVGANTPPASTNGIKPETVLRAGELSTAELIEPPTPPISLEGAQHSIAKDGGIAWYMEPFDPDGTTIHDERWTGREALRDLSEELSEMDEDELENMGVEEDISQIDVATAPGSVSSPSKKKPAKPASRRSRGNDWGTRSFRNRRW